MSLIPHSLIDAYNSTYYHVQSAQGFILKVGEKSDGLVDLYCRFRVGTSVFITAFNPYSQSLRREENIKRNKSLKNELDDISRVVIQGYGQDPDGLWEKEDSFLAFDISLEEAKQLGNKYGQNAILWCDADCTPQLILLR